MQAIFLEDVFCNIVVKVFRSITESGEYDDFTVVVVERMLDFVVDIGKQLLQFGIVFRRHDGNHLDKFRNGFAIGIEITFPGLVVQIV